MLGWDEYYIEACSAKCLIDDLKTEKTEQRVIDRLEVIAYEDNKKERSRKQYQVSRFKKRKDLNDKKQAQIANAVSYLRNPFIKKLA